MGKGVANPIGTFWSAVMMLDNLGEKDAASRLMNAIERVTADKRSTRPISAAAPHRGRHGGAHRGDTRCEPLEDYRFRHGRACPGHPPLRSCRCIRTWMPATSAGMTKNAAHPSSGAADIAGIPVGPFRAFDRSRSATRRAISADASSGIGKTELTLISPST